MSLNSKYLYGLVVSICVLVLAFTTYRFIYDENHELFNRNLLDIISAIEDPVEKKEAYRDYWGREITNTAFLRLFDVKTEDENVIRYSVQIGSADGDRDAFATAYFIGNPVPLSKNISVIRSNVEKNIDKYYGDIGDAERTKLITGIIEKYLPGSDRFNGVFLIIKSGEVFADFNGVHIPMDITEEKMNAILNQVRPMVRPIHVGVFEENI